VDVDIENAKSRRKASPQASSLYADGLRTEEGVVGYAVVWKKGHMWKGHKEHIGYNLEAYGAMCAAPVHAPRTTASRTNQTAQAGNGHHLHRRPGRHLEEDFRRPRTRPKVRHPGQEAHQNLRRKESYVRIAIRWCPSHQGIEGNGKLMRGPNSPLKNRTPTGRVDPARNSFLTWLWLEERSWHPASTS